MYLDFNPINSFYWAILIFILGIVFSLKIGLLVNLKYKYNLFLYFWHLLFCIFYFIFVLSNGGDAVNYFKWAINNEREFGLGTGFVVGFTSFFSNYLNFSFFDLFLLYNFFGYIGLLFFAASIDQAVQGKLLRYKLLAVLLVLLPSVSFWTSAIGKDAIAFMAVGMALWSSLNYRSRKILLIFSIFIMLLVRPHIAFVLLISFIFSLIFNKNINFYTRIFLGLITSSASVIIFPLIINYVGLQDANDVSDVSAYIDQRQSYNADGGSSVDISSMSLPMQMLTYMYRPLPFEAHSIFALLASFDNLLLILLSLIGLFYIFKKNKPSVNSNRLFLWLYFYISLIILATTTANLGIAMRQKWMILPFLIFLLLSVIGNNELKVEKKR
ncbi:hypothetical protein F4U02_14830 [Acinetobacter haemolyticus]|nr:hypothetical protein [Acinetobacter haemolyticus]